MEVTLLKCLPHPSQTGATAMFWNLPAEEQMAEITGLASASFFSLFHSDYCTSLIHDSLACLFLLHLLASSFSLLPSFFSPRGFQVNFPVLVKPSVFWKTLSMSLGIGRWSLLIFPQMSQIKILNKITAKTNSPGVPAGTSPQPFTFLFSTTCS